MNIFKKIKLANKILNLIKDLKKYFDNNVIADKIKQKIEKIVKDIQDLGELIPDVKKQLYEIASIIKEFFNDDKKAKLK